MSRRMSWITRTSEEPSTPSSVPSTPNDRSAQRRMSWTKKSPEGLFPASTTSTPKGSLTPTFIGILSQEKVSLKEFLDEGPSSSSSGTSTPLRIQRLRQKARRFSWKRKGSELEPDRRELVQDVQSRNGSYEDLEGFEGAQMSPMVGYFHTDHLSYDSASPGQVPYEGVKSGFLHGLAGHLAQIPCMENAPRAKGEESPGITSLEEFLNHPVSRPRLPHAFTDPSDLDSFGEEARKFGASAPFQLWEEVQMKIDHPDVESVQEDDSDARSVISFPDKVYDNVPNFSDDLPEWADPEMDVSRVSIRKSIGTRTMKQQLLVKAQELRSKARRRNSSLVSLETYDIQDLIFNTSNLTFRVEARSDMTRKSIMWPNNYKVSILPPHGGEIGVFVQWGLDLVEGTEFCKTMPLPMSIRAKRGLGIIGEQLWYERYSLSSSERFVDDLGGPEYGV
ncbi:hypothetical protein B0J14DRAFT_569413 [Halenospora varia]|nr:hypothetical protein B0J14DRAFT_569413 [Halenospora varia]